MQFAREWSLEASNHPGRYPGTNYCSANGWRVLKANILHSVFNGKLPLLTFQTIFEDKYFITECVAIKWYYITMLKRDVFFVWLPHSERWDITNICNFQRKHPPNIGKSRHILTNHSSTENPQDISRQSHLFPSFVRFCAKFSWQLIWVNVTNAFPRTANWICASGYI